MLMVKVFCTTINNFFDKKDPKKVMKLMLDWDWSISTWNPKTGMERTCSVGKLFSNNDYLLIGDKRYKVLHVMGNLY